MFDSFKRLQLQRKMAHHIPLALENASFKNVQQFSYAIVKLVQVPYEKVLEERAMRKPIYALFNFRHHPLPSGNKL